MSDLNEQKWSHNEYKERKIRINRLKKVENELLKIDIPLDIFGAEIESIRAKLKSVSQVEKVEEELEALKKKIAQFQAHLRENVTTEAKAIEALQTAVIKIEEIRVAGCSVSEAESLLSEAREMLDVKDYQLAGEHATRAAQLAEEVKRTAKPQVTVEMGVDNYSTDEWRAVDLGVVNQGEARAKAVELSFSAEVETKRVTQIAELDIGARHVMRIDLKPRNAGEIPLNVRVFYKDTAGMGYSVVQRFLLKVGRAPETNQPVEKPMSDVFISHVEEDSVIALGIALGLEEAGYTTWCYELDILPGALYITQVGLAIDECRAMMLIISPHSLGSNHVTNEVVRAYEDAKHFIPVLHNITDADFKKRQPLWRQCLGAVASTPIPKEGIDSIMARVIAGLKALEIYPKFKPDNATRVDRIRKALGG